jgi:hypothetical protein
MDWYFTAREAVAVLIAVVIVADIAVIRWDSWK